MKRITLACLAITALGGTLLFVGCSKNAPEATSAESVSNVTEAPAPAPAQEVVVTRSQPATVAAHTEPAPVVETPPAAPAEVNTNELYEKTFAVLISTNSTFHERYEALAQLKASGRLKDAILDMELKAKEDPGSAVIPTMIGQAMLQAISSDMDIRQKGILALGADQRFDDALKNDPNNWDAQYYKAASLSYWPANMNKGPEVEQRLNDLIQQQESSSQQPQYVRSYIVLGDYYTRAGDNTSARQAWQRGLSQFPNDPGLMKRLYGQ